MSPTKYAPFNLLPKRKRKHLLFSLILLLIYVIAVSFISDSLSRKNAIKINEIMPFLGETVADVAGEVIELGSAVSNFKVGDKVVAMLNFQVSELLYLVPLPPLFSHR